MSLKHVSPKTLTSYDMFIWWAKEKIRKKRHLRIRDMNTHANPATLISNNKDELDWLRKNALVLAEQIDVLERSDNSKGYFTAETKAIYEKKSELYNGENRIKHLEQVDSKSTHEIMSERLFKEVIRRFNISVRNELVDNGKVINMKSYLGFMYIQKVHRNDIKLRSKSSAMPNWGESNKYKQELIDKGIQIKDKEHPDGKKWIIYYTDDYYLKYTWTKNKGACRVKNNRFYSFVPTTGRNGPKRQLCEANFNNPYLHKTYTHRKLYYPKLDPNYKGR